MWIILSVIVGLGILIYSLSLEPVSTDSNDESILRGLWINKVRCVKCKTTLTDYEEAYSDGRCPYCGNKSKSTFVKVDEYMVRNIYKQVYIFGFIPWREFVRLETREDS